MNLAKQLRAMRGPVAEKSLESAKFNAGDVWSFYIDENKELGT